MTHLITGGWGFLGWHLRCRLRALGLGDPSLIGRDGWSHVQGALGPNDGDVVIYHLAGVNRGPSEESVETGNVALAERLATELRRAGRPVRLVYANSTHSLRDTPYGRGKRRAAEILREATEESGGTMADVVLPNLFGEHGRPGYNSFVATFCHAIVTGGEPSVSEDRELPLLHAQRAAEALHAAASSQGPAVVTPQGEMHSVSEVLGVLRHFAALYGTTGELPDLSDPFVLDLFNTYRSYMFPSHFPMFPQTHGDARGRLFETVRTRGGEGQAFVSTTVPGATRGEHYHLRKVERFFVVTGEAEIALRRLHSTEVTRLRLSGDSPAFVDMPTMWVHNIRNVGDSELVTMFWSDQLLDPTRPDQYPEAVDLEVTA